MKGQSVGGSQAPVTLNGQQDNKKSSWTCVNWYKNISELTASKTSSFFGHAVASFTLVVAFIPSLTFDFGHAVIKLYDRRISKPKALEQSRTSSLQHSASSGVPENSLPHQTHMTLAENEVSSPATQAPAAADASESLSQTSKLIEDKPSPNLPIIQGAKVQWRRYIHDDNVRSKMESYDQFFAKHITTHPEEIPKEAYRQLKSGASIGLITQDDTKTVDLKKKLGSGGSKVFYDIGDGQALALIAGSHQQYDELMMLRYLESLHIPTNEIKPAIIYWEYQGVKYTRATYIAPSFNSYAEQNTFVLDSKKDTEVMRRMNGRQVLSDDQNPFSVENWDNILKPLVQDIRVLVDNGVDIKGDALNAIIAGKGSKFHSGSDADYEARAFPFDFSSKHTEQSQLPVKRQLSLADERKMLKSFIEEVVGVQFYFDERTGLQKQMQLIESLTERYLRKRTPLQNV